MEKNLPEQNNSKSCDKWLQRIAQLASILTSIALAVFAGMQIYINDRIHEEDKALHQPIFQIVENYKDFDGDANPYYNNLEVHNIGEPVQQIKDIDISTYLQFEYRDDYKCRDNYKSDTFYIPIIAYFGVGYYTPNLTGLIRYTKTPYPNFGEFGRILNETRNGRAPSEFAHVTLIHVTKIIYIDLFGEEHTKIFYNKNIADEKQVAKIKQRSEEEFEYKMWYINELSFSKIKEICYK